MCDIMLDSMKAYAEKRVLEGELRGERREKLIGELKAKVDTVNNMLDGGIDFKTALEFTRIDEKTYFDEMNRRKGLLPQ